MKNEFSSQIYHECYGKHLHDHPQILIPLEKTLHIWIDDTAYDVTPQQLCYIPSGLLHQCNFSGLLQVINLVPSSLRKESMSFLTSPLIISIREQMMSLVSLIHAELTQNPNSKSVHYLYDYLYSKLMENCAAPSIRYISEHYDLSITIRDLARIENYNATYYSDWFKQQTGFSPSLYLRCIRINRAKELLTSTSFNVMEIALMVGYSSNSTFTRAFHNITGMTPKAYRDCPCWGRSV